MNDLGNYSVLNLLLLLFTFLPYHLFDILCVVVVVEEALNLFVYGCLSFVLFSSPQTPSAQTPSGLQLASSRPLSSLTSDDRQERASSSDHLNLDDSLTSPSVDDDAYMQKCVVMWGRWGEMRVARREEGMCDPCVSVFCVVQVELAAPES